METDSDTKRKRKEISSVSKLDTSGAINSPKEEQKPKQKKKKKPKTDTEASGFTKQEEMHSKGESVHPNV